jgi:hypothetical protein
LTGHDGKDLRNCAFLDHNGQVGAIAGVGPARRTLLRIARIAFEPVSLGAEGIVFKQLGHPSDGPAWIALQWERSGNWNRFNEGARPQWHEHC